MDGQNWRRLKSIDCIWVNLKNVNFSNHDHFISFPVIWRLELIISKIKQNYLKWRDLGL